MIGFTDGANDVLADLSARRSEGEPAGGFERPAAILDWHYASSPFCVEMQQERIGLLGTAAPGSGDGDEWSPYGSIPAHAQVAANDNARMRLVL